MERNNFDTLVCTAGYFLWNAWLFGEERRQHRPITLAQGLTEEYNLLIAAREKRVEEPNSAARE
jgi:hypothetical protein